MSHVAQFKKKSNLSDLLPKVSALCRDEEDISHSLENLPKGPFCVIANSIAQVSKKGFTGKTLYIPKWKIYVVPNVSVLTGEMNENVYRGTCIVNLEINARKSH